MFIRQKLLKHQYMKILHMLFSLLCKIHFLLVLSKCSNQSKERVRTCKDYIISREITTVLKIAAVFGKKLLKCWYKENVTDIVFFTVCEKYIFWLYRSVGFEGNTKYAKKRNYIVAMECTDLAAFTLATCKWDCSLCKLISSEATVINLLAIVGLGNWSKFFRCFFKVS